MFAKRSYFQLFGHAALPLKSCTPIKYAYRFHNPCTTWVIWR